MTLNSFSPLWQAHESCHVAWYRVHQQDTPTWHSSTFCNCTLWLAFPHTLSLITEIVTSTLTSFNPFSTTLDPREKFLFDMKCHPHPSSTPTENYAFISPSSITMDFDKDVPQTPSLWPLSRQFNLPYSLGHCPLTPHHCSPPTTSTPPQLFGNRPRM